MDYKKTYKKIEKRYLIIAILLIVFFITGQIIIQRQINLGKDMARIINISGRQRMLSHKITKDSLMIGRQNDQFNYYLKDLQLSLETFKDSHQDLVNGRQIEGGLAKNSAEIRAMFIEVDPYFKNIVASAHQIHRLASQEPFQGDLISQEIQILNENERLFLEKMDQIVFQYEEEAGENVRQLEQRVTLVFYLIIFAILIISLLVIIPARKTLRHAFVDINESNENFVKLFQTMKGALFLINEDGRIVMHNSDAEKIMISNKEDHHIEKAIKWLNVNIGDCLDKARAGEIFDKMEIQIEDKHGEILTMLMTAIRGKYHQEEVILISAYDISDQKRAQQLLKDRADRDELTGLYNRHFLEAIIGSEIQRSKRYEYPLSAAIFDIDDFKVINDTWGHPVGDLILQEIALLLMDNSRGADYPLRIGGEEFVILMPHTDLEGAYILAEKLRKLIEKRNHPIVGQYTVSVGVAQIKPAENYLELYNRMDAALYQAKQRGKNCVVKAALDKDQIVSLKWKKSWESGEETIDRQHQQLLVLMDEIMDQKNEIKGREALMRRLERLTNDVKDHFKYEEGLLKEIGYGKYLEHKKIHDDLLKKTDLLQEKLLGGDLDSRQICDFMFHDLIVGHILREDTQFFDAVKNYGIRGRLDDPR